jgi:hypothetical protein
MDEQQIELIGTAALSAALIREGFEIAHPVRDHGIDLIVFSDAPGLPFSAIPIQNENPQKKLLGYLASMRNSKVWFTPSFGKL